MQMSILVTAFLVCWMPFWLFYVSLSICLGMKVRRLWKVLPRKLLMVCLTLSSDLSLRAMVSHAGTDFPVARVPELPTEPVPLHHLQCGVPEWLSAPDPPCNVLLASQPVVDLFRGPVHCNLAVITGTSALQYCPVQGH